MEIVWTVSGGCLLGVWWVSSGCLEGVLMVSERCLEGIYGMSKEYERCLNVSEGQVRTNQVRIGKVRCLKGVSKVFAGQLWDVQGVVEVSRCF